MKYYIRVLAILSVPILFITQVLAQSGANTLDVERIRSATVLIFQAQSTDDNLLITCVGSGTIVSRNGLILTNAHNVVTSPNCSGNTLIIALTVSAGEPPVPKFRAEIAQVDIGLDLALLRITRRMDGQLIQQETLALPFVELADSSTVVLDQTVTVFGYDSVGSEPVIEEVGIVNGFIAEPSAIDRSWIKTSASISGTMSGGGAYNRDSELIGIPTTAPVTGTNSQLNCQPMQDTNTDGVVNQSDICIPVGGFINSLRPSNLARPLLRGALLGLQVQPLTAPRVIPQPSGNPTFRRLFFSPSVVDGMPTTVIRSLPTGSSSLYLFFDYENMTPETVYELRVTIEGRPEPVFSLAPVRWSGGESGMWYIGTNDRPLENGIYDFTLVANGITSETRRLVVGGLSEPTPSLSNILFGLEDTQGNVYGNGYVIPTGSIASARFVYHDMTDGVDYTVVWYYNGAELVRTASTWAGGVAGADSVRFEATNGLAPGIYRLELYLGSNLSATSDFVVAGAQRDAFPEIFVDTHFASANNTQDALTANPVTSLPTGVSVLYSLFDWRQMAMGTPWTMRWSVDGEVFYERTAPWNIAPDGENFLSSLTASGNLPDGTYQMELFVNNFRIASTQAQIGIGQLPIDQFSQASGIQLRGRIIDSATKEGISGVTFILLSPDFSIQQFTWSQEQIYTFSVTDRNGFFQLDRPLELAAPYSVMVVAEGYLPVSADGFEVDATTQNPLEITLELTRG